MKDLLIAESFYAYYDFDVQFGGALMLWLLIMGNQTWMHSCETTNEVIVCVFCLIRLDQDMCMILVIAFVFG